MITYNMSIFTQIEEKLLETAHETPLEIFSFLGSFIEEIIAPIPSPIIMTTTGSIAALQDKPVMFLLILAVFGALGKMFGALVVYKIADIGEDLIVNKFGRFIGITHVEVENFGKHFSKTRKDVLVLILLRSIPFIPSTLVSVSSGILKINVRHFMLATFLGTIIRDSIFLYFGYRGVEAFSHILGGFDTLESVLQALGVLVLAVILGLIYYKKGKGNIIESVRRIIKL